jgi:adenine/guanine phosphoribosyltransferase-like PRPP-binding protein
MSTDKIALDFVTIARRIKEIDLPSVDWVVGIATGGVVPACLAAYQIDRPMSLLRINYRADDNRPQRDAPAVLDAFSLPDSAQTILLVDDVLKGQGDLVAFPDIAECIKWPWKES